MDLARLSKSEIKWSISSEDAKKSGKQRQVGSCHQDPGSPILCDTPGTPFPFGTWVKAKFQGTWYNGTIQGSCSKGLLVLFDGSESQGVSETTLRFIRNLVPTDAAPASNNTEHVTPPQLTVNNTPRRIEGQLSEDGSAQQDDDEYTGSGNVGNGDGGWGSVNDNERDGNGNTDNGGVGWGSGSTQSEFRQSSGEPY